MLYTPRGPALIDPAVYRHYPEVDLAMLTLFGAPGEAFFETYWNGDAPADWPRREARGAVPALSAAQPPTAVR